MKTRATLTATKTPVITRRDLWLKTALSVLAPRLEHWRISETGLVGCPTEAQRRAECQSIAEDAQMLADAMEAEEAKRQKQQPEASAT